MVETLNPRLYRRARANLARAPKPTYHCKKCNAMIYPKDEKCPNGHDLSIVGKIIKLYKIG